MSLSSSRPHSVLRRQQRFPGQAMVEFALVATIFFSLVFGVIEGGRLLFTYHQVNHAAREGARYAAAHGSKSGNASDAEILAHIQSKTTGLSSDSIDFQRDPLGAGTEPREQFQVTVTYDFEPIVGLIFGTSAIELTSESTMRYHY